MRRLWLALLLAGCQAPDPGPTVTLAPATFEASLVERGQIGSEQEIKLSSVFQAKVDTLVPEGTVVKPGQLVAKLDDVDAIDQWERAQLKARQTHLQLPLTTEKDRLNVWSLGLERDNAKLDLQIAKLGFKQLVTVRDAAAIVDAAQGLGTLEAERKTLADTLPEAAELHRKGYLSDVDFNAMRRKLAENLARTASERVLLKTLEVGPQADAIALERLKVESAASALTTAVTRLQAAELSAKLDVAAARRAVTRTAEAGHYRATLRAAARMVAPVAGVVTYEEMWTGSDLAKVKVGDTVDEGTAMVTIMDPSRQVVRATIDDARAARLAVGGAVRCQFDAYPALVIAGHVLTIAPVATGRLDNDVNKLQGVEVAVALSHSDPRLMPGMSANMTFVLAAQPGQLLLPSEAIAQDAKGPYVYVLPPGQRWAPATPQRREIKLGLSNDRETDVVAGLAAGDVVLLGRPRGAS